MPWCKLADIAIRTGPPRRAVGGRSAWVIGACMGPPSLIGALSDLSRGVLSNKLHKMPWCKLADIAIRTGPTRRAVVGRSAGGIGVCMGPPSHIGTPLDLS